MSIFNAPASIGGAILDPIAAKLKNPFSTNVGKVSNGPDFPKGFRFVEIVNGRERDKDAVQLLGNLMPKDSLDFGGEQRITKDYYPGNSEPTAQVLGPKESDVVIHGRLYAKRYKDANYIAAPEAIQRQIDAIRIRGNLLRITLGTWQRYGFLEKVEFKMKRLSDIEYTLTFSIIGFNPPKNLKFASSNKNSPNDINKSLIAEAVNFQATHGNIPASVPRSLADELNGIISDVAKNVNLVTGFVDTVLSTAESIDAVAHRALGLIKNARAFISRSRRRVGALKFDLNHIQSEKKAALQFKSAYSNQRHIVDTLVAMASLSAILAALQKRFEALSKQVPQARYLVKNGDTLQGISMKYYNTSDNWDKIYSHNKLTSTNLVVGTVLEIPKV